MSQDLRAAVAPVYGDFFTSYFAALMFGKPNSEAKVSSATTTTWRIEHFGLTRIGSETRTDRLGKH
jgi:hypothetical protein